MKNRSLLWIKNTVGKSIYAVLLLTIIGMLYSYIGVRFAIASKNAIDSAVFGDNMFAERVAVLAAFVVVQLLLSVIYNYLGVYISGRITIRMREKVFKELIHKDWQSLMEYHSGDLLNRIYNDIGIVESGVMGIIPSGATLITRVVCSFAALYALDRNFALICICICPLVLTVSRIYSKRMKKLHKACQESDGKIRSFMLESLQNVLVIKSFGGEGIITQKSRRLQFDNFGMKLKRNNISIAANIAFYIAVTAGYYFALVWCAYKISAGIMTVGTLTAVLQLFGQLETPFKSVSGLLPKYYNMIASAERIIELEDIDTDSADNMLDGNLLYNNMEAIRLENLSFEYDRSNIIFENTELTVNKGDFIAVAGISGIGKSTLLKLLMGILRPSGGSLFVQTDKSKIPLGKSTRGLFAYVPQGNMILSGTLRENITFFKENADEDKIIAAAKAAEIWSLINGLPMGLDTVVGEKGLGLSEGQVQRIAIARAVYYDAPILLLDEATSALDEATEAKVLANLRRIKNKMCITVSHKPAALNMCDKRIDIDNGMIFVKNIHKDSKCTEF